jgi:serine/threonine protein kinase
MLVGRSLGQYHILEKTGRGGMASVYKAQDLVNDRIVAVKVLAPQLAVEVNFRDRFRREAKILCRLSHPNIVPILDYGEIDNLNFIVMPFMKSRSLRERLQHERISYEECAHILDQISSALQYAHEAGIVHRDIKPSNILIDDNGKVWLSDFGFAHIHNATQSLTGSALIGTPAFMAPEQVRGEPVSPLSDQYSLGVVLYQMATGSLPYDADTPMAIAISHVTEPMPRPKQINPDVPSSLERVILKALAKSPAHRYESIVAFIDAVKQAISVTTQATNSLFGWRTRVLQGMDFWYTLKYQIGELLLKPQFLRRSAIIAGVILIMAFPLAAAALVGDGSRISSQAYQATLDMLYTENAPQGGTPENPGLIQTAVAGTLSVLEAERQAIVIVGASSPTGDPGDFMVSTPTPTVTFTEDSATSVLDPFPTATSAGSSGQPKPPTYTFTPQPTSEPTSEPPPSPTSEPPTDEPPPTDVPDPTKTPKPTKPPKVICNKGHPCTPTPTP